MKKLLPILLITLLAGCTGESSFDLNKVMYQRPDKGGLIFDYVGLMDNLTESTTGYLENIRNRYHIEILIAAIPSLYDRYSINQAAQILQNQIPPPCGPNQIFSGAAPPAGSKAQQMAV